MSWLWWALAGMWALDAIRMRRRAAAWQVLAPEPEGESTWEWIWVAAPAVVIDEPTRITARAWAAARDLQALDLVPADLAAGPLATMLALGDPPTFREDRLGKALSAGHAILVRKDLLEAALPPPGARPREDGTLEVADPLDMVELFGRLKSHAPLATDSALAPRLRARPDTLAGRLALVQGALGPEAGSALLIQIFALGFAFAGLAIAPIAALVALLAFQLQPLIATLGGPLAPRDLPLVSVSRSFYDLFVAILLRGRLAGPPGEPGEVRHRRATYANLLAEGTAPFFLPPGGTCRICGSEALRLRLHTPDLLQHKPGAFTLMRCESCGTVQQEPRLSERGLAFYYRDFYDGLGERLTGSVFGYADHLYRARAGMLVGRDAPQRWVDVGAGHGHFCLCARAIWPRCSFEGIDQSESILLAWRKGWVDRVWKGGLVDLAVDLAAEPADVISMSHYLEHTLDPRAEIASAATAVRPGGHVLIEVPDPESRLGRLLGRYWVGWFQPQHLHLLPFDQMRALVEEAGLEVVEVHRGEAHQPADLLFGLYFFIQHLAPGPDLPWMPTTTALRRLGTALLRAAAMPAALLAWLVDSLWQPLMRRPGWSNTYRLLARKPDGRPLPVLPKDRGDLGITARYTAGAWLKGEVEGARLLDHPEARATFDLVNGALGLSRIGGARRPDLPTGLLQRHAAIDRVVGSAAWPVVLELAAGLSPRGIRFSADPALEITEVDQPWVIARKQALLARTWEGRRVLGRNNLHFAGGDLRRMELDPLVRPGQPLTIVAEGLSMYLNATERQDLWRRVHGALAKAGGGTFVFDLVPPAEEPPPGAFGRALGRIMRKATGGHGFVADGATRDRLREELAEAGFSSVEVLDLAELAAAWDLPGAGAFTRQVLWVAEP